MKKPQTTQETQQKCVKPEKNSILYTKKWRRKSYFQVSLQNSWSKTWM